MYKYIYKVFINSLGFYIFEEATLVISCVNYDLKINFKTLEISKKTLTWNYI